MDTIWKAIVTTNYDHLANSICCHLKNISVCEGIGQINQNPLNPDLRILQNTKSTLDYTKSAATATTFAVILSQIFLSLDLNINKLSENEM